MLGWKRNSERGRRGSGRGVTDGFVRRLAYEIRETIADPTMYLYVDKVAEMLRSRNQGYARKPFSVFRECVGEALKIVRENPVSGDSDSDGDDRFVENDSSDNDDDPTPMTANPEIPNVISSAPNTPITPINTPSFKRPRTEAKTPTPSQPKASQPKAKMAKTSATQRAGGASKEGESSQPASNFVSAIPKVRYADLGGIETVLEDVRELIERPLLHPEIYSHLGISPSLGILLHGPTGTGKTTLANAIAGELGVPLFRIAAPEIVSGMSGESEAKIRDLFKEAINQAPCIVFIDEIDAITPKRETAQREMEKRIVSQLLLCLDELSRHNSENMNSPVLVLAATNRPDGLDPSLRSAGRFEREISLGVPDTNARARILNVLCKNLRLAGNFDFAEIAARTPGFVGADLQALAKEAGTIAVNRIFSSLVPTIDSKPKENEVIMIDCEPEPEEVKETPTTPATPATPTLQKGVTEETQQRAAVSNSLRARTHPFTSEELSLLDITMDDFIKALKKVQPSAKREGFATIPNVTWDDIGALDDIRHELNMSIVLPIQEPDSFAKVGLHAPVGVLLYGPPGCGKTMLAKAIANQANANFISVKGPELLNKFVGESERAVRQVFQRARSSAPCIIFFDEMDSICPQRSADSGNQVTERVVNQLLVEMDGLNDRKDVWIIGATNRPDIIDIAIIRPGRLDKLIYVPLPRADERVRILTTICKKIPLAPDVNLEEIGADNRCRGYSGADLQALVREAGLACLNDYFDKRASLGLTKEEQNPDTMQITRKHFYVALSRVLPSVSEQDEKSYERMKKYLRQARKTEEKKKNVTAEPSQNGNEKEPKPEDVPIAN